MMFDTVGVKYVGYDDVQNPRISRLGNPKGHRPKLQKQWSTTLKPTTLKSHPCPSNANPKTESLVSGNTPEPSHERSETMGPYLVEGLAWLLVMSPVIVCILRGSFMCCLFLKAGEGGEGRFSSSPSQWLSLVPKPHPHPPPPHSQTPRIDDHRQLRRCYPGSRLVPGHLRVRPACLLPCYSAVKSLTRILGTLFIVTTRVNLNAIAVCALCVTFVAKSHGPMLPPTYIMPSTLNP